MSAFDLTRIAALWATPTDYLDQPVQVGGWLTSARLGKRVGFLVLTDGSAHTPLQVVVSDTLMAAQPALRTLGAGHSVRVSGQLVVSSGAGQAYELQAQSVTMVGGVDDPVAYPIQPKAHSLEFLRSVPHLRHRVAQFGAVARLRHVLAAAVHAYLAQQDFLWVATPLLSSADAEGAGERFEVVTEHTDPFFGAPAYLTVSGQLEAEALCLALGRVYTFGPTFRAERSHTSRHLAEFWMVEPEMAFATLEDLAHLAQGLLQHAVHACLTQLPDEMAYFAQAGGRSVAEWTAFVTEDFARLTYDDAVARLTESGVAFEVPVAWGMDLQSEHERWLVAEVGRPVVVTDYPAGIKSFYMKADTTGRTVAALDVLVPGVGELIGGSVREEQIEALEARMTDLGMELSQYTFYRDLRRYGSVPHGGFGLGFERLVAYVAGLSSVKDAIAYPRTAGAMTG